ncbi:tumor necrosis factor receptor superfamily member 4-like [Vanacampus margaritifer]
MAALARPIILLLLIGGSLGSLEQRGCRRWHLGKQPGVVCCDECHPGNRLVSDCGAKPQDLCTPCESRTYSQNPKSYRCSRCTQCVGAQVQVKGCTTTTDTKCGCKEGLVCGDGHCSFCAKKCSKGEEPNDKRSCTTCPNGTFNDQIHQKCKPWSAKCPNPGQFIVVNGDAFTDIRCSNVSHSRQEAPESRHKEVAWLLVLTVFPSVCLIALNVSIIKAVDYLKRKKKTKYKSTPVPTEASDDPKQLIAIECSFHEAQEEQGSSSTSLNSRDQLVV